MGLNRIRNKHNNTGVIYQIRNKKNNKVYIGSAINFEKREKIHKWALKKGKHHNIHLQNAWNKYGSASFVFDIIETCITKDDLLHREQYHINKYLFENDQIDVGLCYNIASVSRGGSGPRSEETKKKISDAAKGRIVSEEVKKKLSEINRGKTISEETRRKMSKAGKGRTMSEAARKKMCKAKKNPSKETRKRLSNAQRGENNPRAKLTETQVLEIKRLLKETNLKGIEIAKRFDVTSMVVYNIKKGKAWKHVIIDT